MTMRFPNAGAWAKGVRLAKARGVKLKPGEQVTRRDGSVWEGQASGPPKLVSGPAPKRAYHTSPIRNLQHFDAMRQVRTLQPRQALPGSHGPTWMEGDASNPAMVYFSTQFARDPKKRSAPLAATIHEWSAPHLRLGIVFRNDRALDHQKLHPDEDFIQPEWGEHSFDAQRRLRAAWAKSYGESNAPTIAHEGPVDAHVFGFTLSPADAERDQFRARRDGPSVATTRAAAMSALRQKLTGARRVDGGGLFVPNTPENVTAIRAYVEQQDAHATKAMDAARQVHESIDYSQPERARHQQARTALDALDLPPDLVHHVAHHLTGKGRAIATDHDSNLHVLAGYLANTRPMAKAPHHTTFQGLPIHIEHDVGDTRTGTAPDGTKWATRMKHAYGEILGTLGADGDPLDVFLGPDRHAAHAYVVQAKLPGSQAFDECKLMLGFPTRKAAVRAFRVNYDRPGFLLDVTRWPMPALLEVVREHPELQQGRLDARTLKRLRSMAKARRNERNKRETDVLKTFTRAGKVHTYWGPPDERPVKVGWSDRIDPPPALEMRGATLTVDGFEDDHALVRLDHVRIRIPAASVRWVGRDLRGEVRGPPSGDPLVDAVLAGHAELLGKGDDGLAFRVGDHVVKVSSVVPYNPMNGFAYRTPAQAVAMAREQHKTIEAMRADGVPGLLPERFVEHAGRGFTIKPYVQIPEKLTERQARGAQSIVHAMHDRGWILSDEVQVGLHDGRVVMYDAGKAQNAAGLTTPDYARQDDEMRVHDLFLRHGHRYIPGGGDTASRWRRAVGRAGHPMFAIGRPERGEEHADLLRELAADMRAEGTPVDDELREALATMARARAEVMERRALRDTKKALPGVGRFRALVAAAEPLLPGAGLLAANAEAMEKARGVKIPPGEHVVRKDGSVWVGQLSGPPLRLGKREGRRYLDEHAARAKRAAPFHQRVLDALAKVPDTAPFQGRVAIASLYEHMSADGTNNYPLETFKRELVDEAKARRLHLSPLDLPDAIDAGLRDRSFTRWGSDYVHFVVKPGAATGVKLAAPFHERVLDTIAKMPATAPFTNRIAIAHLYDRMVADGLTTAPLETFKRELVAEGGARRLRLERLDLREGLTDDVRERSHVRWGTDSVHFVLIPTDVHGDRTDGGPTTRRMTDPATGRQATETRDTRTGEVERRVHDPATGVTVGTFGVEPEPEPDPRTAMDGMVDRQRKFGSRLAVAYGALAGRPGRRVAVADLRQHPALRSVPRGEFDRQLAALVRAGAVDPVGEIDSPAEAPDGYHTPLLSYRYLTIGKRLAGLALPVTNARRFEKARRALRKARR